MSEAPSTTLLWGMLILVMLIARGMIYYGYILLNIIKNLNILKEGKPTPQSTTTRRLVKKTCEDSNDGKYSTNNGH
jgi:hypothetical protein